MTIFIQHLEAKHKHATFPLHDRAKGRQQGEGPLNEMCVECREEVDPCKVSMLIFLCGQDIGSKVVPIKEPLMPEHIQHVEHRQTVLQLLGGRGEASSSRGRHCRGSSPFEGVRGSGKSTEG